VIVGAAIGIVALTRDGGDDTATARTTTTDGGDDPATTEGTSPATTAPGGDILPLPGDDWNDEARAQFLVDCEANLDDFLDVGGIDTPSTCACVYDEASTDPAWTFHSFDAIWSADDLDAAALRSDDFRRFSSQLLDCSGV
jgi:hypothetical protein